MPDPGERDGAGDPAAANGDQPPAGDDGVRGDPGPADTDRLKAALEAERKARRDAERDLSERKKRLDQLEEADRKRREAEMSEAEKARAEADAAVSRASQAEQRVREAELRYVVFAEATKLNLHDPEVAYTLIAARAEYDDQGRPTNIPSLLKELAKEKPYLVRSEDSAARGVPDSPKPGEKPDRAEQTRQIQDRLRASGRYSL